MAYNPPIGSIYHLYTTYILASGGLYATYHLLGEPETTIDSWEDFWTTELRELGDAEVVELACGLWEVSSQLMGLAYLVGCDCSWLDFLVHSLLPKRAKILDHLKGSCGISIF